VTVGAADVTGAALGTMLAEGAAQDTPTIATPLPRPPPLTSTALGFSAWPLSNSQDLWMKIF
jgi:hypothetical protein